MKISSVVSDKQVRFNMKVLLVICASVVCMVSAINEEYCSIDCQGSTHIGCRNNEKFSPSCHAKAKVLDISSYKQKFLDLHNELRNKIASGKLPRYKPAAQMGSVTWDDELAKLAEMNVRTCEIKHDQCRNTKNYKYAGQNLAMWAGTPAITPEEEVKKAVTDWYGEHVDADMTVIDKFHDNGKQIGHFTAVVNEKNSRIGCAMVQTVKRGMTAYFVACNYARTNMIGDPVYKTGKPASGCKSGRHSRYTSLCNTSEKYDV